jgi:predicted nucleic acid-binding Zn ribbon protein
VYRDNPEIFSMSLHSLDKILAAITQKAGWEEYRHYDQVLQLWPKIINPRLIEQTRPFSLNRGVLSVATSSAALAQELSLQRYSLLKRLNGQLEIEITDLRFSSARWQQDFDLIPPDAIAPNSLREHPSYVAPEKPRENPEQSAGLRSWSEKIQQRYQSWPICPLCQSPTPSGELDRWQCCAFCFAQSGGVKD